MVKLPFAYDLEIAIAWQQYNFIFDTQNNSTLNQIIDKLNSRAILKKIKKPVELEFNFN